MIRSRTFINKIMKIEDVPKKNKSFNDFSNLNFSGTQKILTFGEYSMKPNPTRANKRKVIKYFYDNLMSKKLKN